jgi:large subunit ribosomal protein L25
LIFPLPLRNTSGKGAMRQLRMQGLTPAVVYGGGADAKMLQLETKTLMAKLLKFYRYNTIVTLKIEGAPEKSVTVGEVQTDPVKDTLIHVDFCEIDLDKVSTFSVPLNFQGTPKGVDLGGEMFVAHGEVMIEGKPLDIPDEIALNVADMLMNDAVKCGELAVPEGLRLVTDADAVAVSIVKAGLKAEDFEDEDEVEVEVEAEPAPEE